jgi:hypothetical protein
MKKFIIITLFFFFGLSLSLSAQRVVYDEKFGNTANIGIGIGGYAGYFSYLGRSLPVFHFDYELTVATDFTLAPFISFSRYTNSYYWGNNNNAYQYYYYHETIVPIGLKATYYFDKLLKTDPNWDFYLAGSLGFAIVNSSWDSGYNGDKNYFKNASPLFLDLHIGTEYHFNNRIGVFLDLSSGVSTIGISIH